MPCDLAHVLRDFIIFGISIGNKPTGGVTDNIIPLDIALGGSATANISFVAADIEISFSPTVLVSSVTLSSSSHQPEFRYALGPIVRIALSDDGELPVKCHLMLHLSQTVPDCKINIIAKAITSDGGSWKIGKLGKPVTASLHRRKEMEIPRFSM